MPQIVTDPLATTNSPVKLPTTPATNLLSTYAQPNETVAESEHGSTRTFD